MNGENLKGARILATVAATAIIASILSIPLPSEAATDSPVGSQWVYTFNDEYLGEVYSGTWTMFCDRIVAAPMGDHRDAYEYHSILSAYGSGNVSGLVYNGTMAASELSYYDTQTFDILGYLSEQHYNFQYDYNGDITSFILDQRNETAYTPPGGIGSEPASLVIGDSWTKTYTKAFNSSGYRNGDYFEINSTEIETLEFVYESSESVSVPAGDFDCEKIVIYYSDGTVETDWYSTDLSEYVMLHYDYVSGETTLYEMSHYSTGTNNGGGGAVEMGSDLFIAGFLIFAGATVVAAVFAYRIVKGKKGSDAEPVSPFAPPGAFP